MNDSNGQAREEGKKHIMYGIIGLVVMVSAYTLLTIAANTFGLVARKISPDIYKDYFLQIFRAWE